MFQTFVLYFSFNMVTFFFGHCFKFDKFLNTSSRYQGRCSKDRSYHYRPGWNPSVDAIFGFTLLLRVLSLTKRGFSPGTPVSRSLKTNTSKFEFDQESGRQRTTVWMCYLFIIICLFIFCKEPSSPILPSMCHLFPHSLWVIGRLGWQRWLG